ncbi:MAG: imidazole glycerol phosphate synthase subunit HisH [Solirubrobacteraceae bacterium]
MSSRPAVAIVDYGMGNRRSVQRALERAGADVRMAHDASGLRGADGLVLPGVGAFPEGMVRLRRRGLDEAAREAVAAGVPLLGICLGMQLLFERSSEHEPTAGLGLLAGEVSPLRAGGLRVPHIGWSDVVFERPCVLTDALAGGGAAFYHVHSLVARPADPEVVAGTTVYGERFASIVARDHVLGVQFHPEKSSRDGLELLRSFTRLCAAGRVGSALSA